MRRPAGFADETSEREYFQTLALHADRHWWHRARRELAREEIKRSQGRAEAALDVGCGTGAMLPLFRRLGARRAIGTDASMEAAPYAAARGGWFVVSDAGRLPFGDASVRCLTSMDVIEHLDDDVAALREYARVTAPGGIVLLMVPAYPWLWSTHDVLVGHRRRYTAEALRAAVDAAGLRPEKMTFFHSWLLPVAVLARRTPLRRLVRGSGEESSYVHPVVNGFFSALCRLERALLRRMPLPFGTSILLVARRP